MENYLGIDFGKSKIGVAIAPEGILAVGFSIVANDKNFYAKLKEIIEENSIKNVVIGIPISMDGGKSDSTKRALEFVSEIKRRFSDLEIFTYDERMTSREARKNLPKRKPDDAEAARIILQGFLDKSKNTKKNIP